MAKINADNKKEFVFLWEIRMKSFRIFFISLLIFIAVPVFADYNRLGVPDSSEIRKECAERWFYPSLSIIREFKPEVKVNSIGQKFQIRLEETDSVFSVIIAPETTLTYEFRTDTETRKEAVSEYLADACGSCILFRDSKTGKPIRIRYYFAKDCDVYVQFSPHGNRTLADYVIGDCYAARSVPVGINFDRLYTASFGEILTFTENALPWQYAGIDIGQYLQKKHMIGLIRKNLSRISWQMDSAYDEDQNPVRVSDGQPRPVSKEEKDGGKLSLSSLGFVKWVVDGLVEPIAGSGTYINPLYRNTVSVNPLGLAGIRFEKDKLSFSLDWTRNLAAARLSVQTRKKYLYEESGVDVKIEPFSAEITENGIKSLAGYVKDTGYDAKWLRPVMYVLGVTEPTYFYLAAIRKRIPPEAGKTPEIYTFDEAAVIFPYFDDNQKFRCVVFKDGKEMSLNSFVTKHNDCYIHLVRVLSSDRFYPQ